MYSSLVFVFLFLLHFTALADNKFCHSSQFVLGVLSTFMKCLKDLFFTIFR